MRGDIYLRNTSAPIVGPVFCEIASNRLTFGRKNSYESFQYEVPRFYSQHCRSTCTSARRSSGPQSIRQLLDTDQKPWQNGDATTILACRTTDYIVAGIPSANGVTDIIGASVGWNFKQMQTRLNDPNWKSSVFSPPELKREAEYEMVRINVQGDNAVAISRIEYSQIDTTINKRLHTGWNSLWILVTTHSGWKFKSAVGGIKQWKRESDPE